MPFLNACVAPEEARFALHQAACRVANRVAAWAFPLGAVALLAALVQPWMMVVGFALAFAPSLTFYRAGGRHTVPRTLWTTVFACSGFLMLVAMAVVLVGRSILFPAL